MDQLAPILKLLPNVLTLQLYTLTLHTDWDYGFQQHLKNLRALTFDTRGAAKSYFNDVIEEISFTSSVYQFLFLIVDGFPSAVKFSAFLQVSFFLSLIVLFLFFSHYHLSSLVKLLFSSMSSLMITTCESYVKTTFNIQQR